MQIVKFNRNEAQTIWKRRANSGGEGMIAIVDYGMGNLRSVTNAFKKLDADVVITREKETIGASSAIVLPGVGCLLYTSPSPRDS